jgi:integrase
LNEVQKHQVQSITDTGLIDTDDFIKRVKALRSDNYYISKDQVDEKKSITLLEYLTEYSSSSSSRFNPYTLHKSPVTNSTLKQYEQIRACLLNFMYYTGESLYLTDINLKWHKEFLTYCSEVEKYGPSNIGKYIKIIKVLLKEAERDGYPVCHDYLKKDFFKPSSSVDTDIPYLNIEELKDIQNLNLDHSHRLQKARDLLVIGCYLGQRISDLKRLGYSDIKTNEAGTKRIHITQKKTGKKVILPIPPPVQNILDYWGYFPNQLSEQKFNDYIKEVCKLAGIDTPIKGHKTAVITIIRKDEAGESYELKSPRKALGLYPKYELITSHTCRRSFASNWYGKLPNSAIMAATGHSKEEDFLRYIKVTPSDHADVMEKEFEKLMAY